MPPPTPDFYGLLQVPQDASPSDIKIAYHHTLLRLHPDKQPRSPIALGPDASVDMALLKEAYRTLSDAGSRAAYDGWLRREASRAIFQPRPAQIVSLEEFVEVTDTRTNVMVQEWQHSCRCGGVYRITQGDLENGTHLVGCESCSEVVWVGYEVVEDE